MVATVSCYSERMEDVSHPRLHKRRNTYYLRASFPADLAHLFNGKERWKSLRTNDHREALRRVRAASAAFDAEMDMLRDKAGSPPANLSQREIVRLCGKLYHHAIERWGDQPGGVVIYDKLIDKMERTVTSQELEAEITPYLEEVLSRSSTVGKIDDDSRVRFRPAGRGASRDAAITLPRHASNDFRPDEIVQRFGVAANKPVGGVTLRRLMDDYMSDPGEKHNSKTLQTYRILFVALEELIGPDKMATEITRDDCKRVRDLLMTLPKNARKHYPQRSLREAARLAKVDGKPLLASGTVNSYLIIQSSLFNWAVEEHIVERNPAKGLLIVDPIKSKDKM